MRITLSALIWCLSGIVSGQAGAATICVSSNGSETPPYDTFANGFRTVSEAIAATVEGDRVTIAAGQYQETLAVGKSLAIVGQGMGATTLDAAGNGACLTLGQGVQLELSGLTLRGGSAEYGGGLNAKDATAILSGVQITDCSAGRGGGIYAESTTLTLSGCVVSYCAALSTLGTSGGKGGAVYLVYSPMSSRSTFTDCAFYGNVAKYGGAMRLWQGRLLVERCHLFSNRAQDSVLEATEVSDINLVDCLFHHNQSLYGTTLEIVNDSQGTLCYQTVADNSSRFGEEAVLVDAYSDVAVWNSVFQRNTPDSVVFSPGTLVTGSVFSTVPSGPSGIVARSDAFGTGPDGSYYAAADESHPTVFIGAGSSECPCTVDNATRKSFVSGPTSASPPNAGYAYPPAAEGKMQMDPNAAAFLSAQGVSYLDYAVEAATDAAFTQGVVVTATGPLAPDFTSLPEVVVPETGNVFFRMRGTSPTGRRATVTVRDAGGVALQGIPIDILTAETFTWCGTAVTQADGTATVTNLPPGEYTVLANWSGTTYVPSYLGNTTDPTAATRFALSALQDAFSGSVTLHVGATVSGRVTVTGVAVAEAVVSAYDADGTVVNSGVSGADGTYSISGLGAGPYRLSAARSPEYATLYWPGAASLDDALTLSLTGTEQKTADFSLSLLPVVMGHVTAPAGTDLSEIVVVLYEAADYSEVSYTFAAADGSFSIHAQPGSYVLSAGEGSELVVAFSEELQLDTGGISGLSLPLEHGGTISGYVLNGQQTPLAGIYIDFYVSDDAGGLNWVNSALSDDGGSYTSPALPPDTYYVQAYGEPDYSSPWYLNTDYPEYAETIPLTVYDDVAGVNFQLAPK